MASYEVYAAVLFFNPAGLAALGTHKINPHNESFQVLLVTGDDSQIPQILSTIMKTNNQLTQYAKALTALTARRNKLQAEVDEINTLLNGTTNGHVRSQEAPRPRRRTTSKNTLTLKEAISQVVRGRALTKQEIIAGVTRIGYKFSTNDPAGSLNALLYSKTGRAEFKNQGGKFSVR